MVAVLAGALAGGLLGSAVYLLVIPAVEASSSWVRELQGMLWNVVPLGTAAGASVALWLTAPGRRRRR